MHGLSDDKSDGYENGTYGAYVEGGTHAGARARTRAYAHMRVDGTNVCTEALYPDQPIDLALIPDIDPDEFDPPE
jgi:hypothetical protein